MAALRCRWFTNGLRNVDRRTVDDLHIERAVRLEVAVAVKPHRACEVRGGDSRYREVIRRFRRGVDEESQANRAVRHHGGAAMERTHAAHSGRKEEPLERNRPAANQGLYPPKNEH